MIISSKQTPIEKKKMFFGANSAIFPKPEIFTKKLPMVTTKAILIKNIIIFV
jgi:hypothetical protein